MSEEDDRRAWAAEQAERDRAVQKQREREKRARERSARNAQRKLARLRRTLEESGEITEFEEEFSGSVAERLDKYGSAFADPSKGRPGDALSASQKRVVAAMNKKVKEARRASKAVSTEETSETKPVTSRRTIGFKPRIVK